MSIYEAIGIGWVILSTVYATTSFFYVAFYGVSTLRRQLKRGQSEEFMDHEVERTANQLLRRNQ